MGSAIHAENEDFISPVMARQSLLKAGLPPQTKSVTVDGVWFPSMMAMQLAFNAIGSREADIAIAVGAESFSCVPCVIDRGNARPLQTSPSSTG